MTQKFSVPRGTADVLPADIEGWQTLEALASSLFKLYNYKEIRTPIFEETELFARSIGATSDIVMKQMLNLSAQRASADDPIELSGLTLRPEGTASIVRSYIENRLDKKEPLSKLYYSGAMFRGERPQKGRLRQFHQIGAEVIGPDSLDPYIDAEIIGLCMSLLKLFQCNTNKLTLKINTLGTKEDKENFSQMLREKIKPHFDKLSEDSKSRFERNVFRILDSKSKEDIAIVQKLDLGYEYLSSASFNYFDNVKSALTQLDIRFEEDIKLVRGLDYYTHTVFEVSAEGMGSQSALAAGGRYGGLVEQLGGPAVDAVGFALGVERVLLAQNNCLNKQSSIGAYVLALDEGSKDHAFNIVSKLRDYGISAEMNFKGGSMKSQMRAANKASARFAFIVGDEEVKEDKVTIKDMKESTQQQVSVSELEAFVEGLEK